MCGGSSIYICYKNKKRKIKKKKEKKLIWEFFRLLMAKLKFCSCIVDKGLRISVN